jgi:hypothetical protein
MCSLRAATKNIFVSYWSIPETTPEGEDKPDSAEVGKVLVGTLGVQARFVEVEGANELSASCRRRGILATDALHDGWSRCTVSIEVHSNRSTVESRIDKVMISICMADMAVLVEGVVWWWWWP